MTNHSQKVTWHEIHPILPQKAGPQSLEPQKAVQKSEKLRNPRSPYIHAPYPGRLAYIHAHSLMIVGIDTIASDDGGHWGTGGGGGEQQGWKVVEGEYIVCTKRYVWRICQVTGGGEVYVCARE